MINEMVKNLRGSIMSKLYNLGCSFAYGNCTPKRNQLCDEHKGPGTMIAQYMDREEVNLARNGNSIDGVLRRLYTYDFEKDGIVLIGVPPSGRFQVINDSEQIYNKERGYKSSLFGKTTESQKCIKYAYTKGPGTRGDFFHTLKWAEVSNDNINETSSYHVLFNILLIQKRLQELGLKYYIYNSIGYRDDPKNKETNIIRDQIDWTNYYKPETSMFDMVKSNVDYELAEGDQHPNHYAYRVWSEGFIDWLENK